MTDSPWTFDGESAHVGGSDAVTLVDGATFLMCGRSGDIVERLVQGLFLLDTRVVSHWVFTVDGTPVQPLAVTPNGPFSATFVGRVQDPMLVDAPLSVIQRRHVGRGMRADIEIRNHGTEAASHRVELHVGSDFGGLFDVKAGRENNRVRHMLPTQSGGVRIPALTDDRAVDATIIDCASPPDLIRDDVLSWIVALQPGERWTNCLLVRVESEGQLIDASFRCGEPVEEAIPVSRLRQWQSTVTTIDTDHEPLTAAFAQASEDLGALRIFDPDHPERVVVAAGAPWFMTLFGRDSLLASWMALTLDHGLAVGVLQELAEAQGMKDDAKTEEQPGRILHEVRFDKASARLLGGSNTYYGSVDATPLFVMLVAELARWGGVTTEIEALMPAVDRAVEWMERDGDQDGDGFIEYFRRDPSGLENQGWKDSWDGIRHADGTVARGPIALCEVQGYAYAALRGRAELARARSEPTGVADSYERRALELQQRFNERFWLDDRGWYAVGLDGDKTHIDSLTSNVGHLLWTGIVPADRAHHLAEHLAGPSMFTGWGVRTLSAQNPAYNPLAYHCGSVWPHDTALAVAGLSRYGCDEAAQRIAIALLAASGWTRGRLPELFAGFDSDDLPSPVPYPASSSPQAWAAASPLLLVRAMLGFEPDLLNGKLRLRPRLPESIRYLRLSDIPVGDSRVDVAVEGGEVTIAGVPAGVEVEINRP